MNVLKFNCGISDVHNDFIRSFTEFSSEKFLKLMYVLKLFLAGFILPFICTEIKLWTKCKKNYRELFIC
jgi:hypothetical protein